VTPVAYSLFEDLALALQWRRPSLVGGRMTRRLRRRIAWLGRVWPGNGGARETAKAAAERLDP